MTPYPEADSGIAAADRRFVRSEQVRLLYRNAGAALLVNLLNAVLLLLGVADIADTALAVWLTALVTVTLGRAGLVVAYRRSPTAPTDPEPWARRYVVGAALAGTLWGTAGILIVSQGTMVHQAYAAFILGGMSAGAIATSASVMAAYLTFALPTLLPVAFFFLLQGDRLHVVMGVMTLVFAAALLATARNAGTLLRSVLDLQLRNAAINTELSRHREQLERLVEARTSELAEANSTLREREVELRRQADRLALADRRKDEFLATLGHELRNPLAAIRSAVEALGRRQDGADPGLEWATRLIDRQSGRLVRLVDDLLDVARITHGKIRLRMEPLALAAAVNDAADAARPMIDAQGHRLEIAAPDEPVTVRGDRLRLAQVVENLLVNAAKYTPAGGTIRLGVDREGDTALIRVRDNGIGIAPERLERVFDAYHQDNQANGGLGLGLALTKNLVELHGGRVTASSSGPGAGSEFVVRLPAEAAPAIRRTPQPHAAAPPVARHRVLVVDDNADAADSLAVLLQALGEETRVAYGGKAALETAAGFHPEIAIIDLGMPGMDGYELAERLRALFPTGLRLIALSGKGRARDAPRDQGTAFDLHLVKPADVSDLQRALNP